MKKQLNERRDVPDVLYGKGQESYDSRLDKLNKKVNTLFALVCGFLLGHFLGIIVELLKG